MRSSRDGAGSGLDSGLDVDDDEDAGVGGAVVDGGAAEVPPGMDDEVEVSQGTFEIHFKKFATSFFDEVFFGELFDVTESL